MATSSVCTYHTEMLTDQTRELSNDQRSPPQFGSVIEVGKAVISTRKKIFKNRWNIFEEIFIENIMSENISMKL